MHDAIHEYAHDVAVLITDVLIFAIHVVRTKDGKVQAELFVSRSQIQFHSILRNTIRVFRQRQCGFQHRNLTSAINGDRTGEDKMGHSMPDSRIDQIHAADEIIHIIEAADEMAQPLSRISGQMKYVAKGVFFKQPFDEFVVSDAAFHETDTPGSRDIFNKTTGEIIEDDDL